MGQTWLTADWHLGETRFQIMGRPFTDQMEFVDYLVAKHNELVKPDDTLIVVGDVCNKQTPEFLSHVARFNGRKTLIRGNHDTDIPDSEFSKYFELIIPEGKGIILEFDGIPCYITHYPTCGSSNLFNLVGHIHAAWKYQLNMLNVGIDVHHFLPINSNTIGFHFKAICEFYDEDVWVAYNAANTEYCGIRGKKGRYFNR
jgi:calcineurin-like phosphoesterase family protein